MPKIWWISTNPNIYSDFLLIQALLKYDAQFPVVLKPPNRRPNSWSTSITLIGRQAPAFYVQVSYIPTPRAWKTCSSALRVITRTMISEPTWNLRPWRTTDCNSGLARRCWRIRIKPSVVVSINLDAGNGCTNMILEFLWSRSTTMSRFGLMGSMLPSFVQGICSILGGFKVVL